MSVSYLLSIKLYFLHCTVFVLLYHFIRFDVLKGVEEGGYNSSKFFYYIVTTRLNGGGGGVNGEILV